MGRSVMEASHLGDALLPIPTHMIKHAASLLDFTQTYALYLHLMAKFFNVVLNFIVAEISKFLTNLAPSLAYENYNALN